LKLYSYLSEMFIFFEIRKGLKSRRSVKSFPRDFFTWQTRLISISSLLKKNSRKKRRKLKKMLIQVFSLNTNIEKICISKCRKKHWLILPDIVITFPAILYTKKTGSNFYLKYILDNYSNTFWFYKNKQFISQNYKFLWTKKVLHCK